MSNKTFSVRSNAIRNARGQLGKDAKQGVHFTVGGDKGAYTWAVIDGSSPVETIAPVDATEMVSETVAPVVVVKKARNKVTKPVAKYLKGRKGAEDVSGKRRKLVKLITSEKGASLAVITKALGWQKHTVRGAISTLASDKVIKKLESTRDERRGRVYKAVAA